MVERAKAESQAVYGAVSWGRLLGAKKSIGFTFAARIHGTS
jgi:hypothetical protein